MPQGKLLLVDLNNFARYPTIAVGLLAAIGRSHDYDVRVFSPLFVGFQGVAREPQSTRLQLAKERLSYWSSQSSNAIVRSARAWAAQRAKPALAKEATQIVEHFARALDEHKPDAVLVSAYLMYYDACVLIGHECEKRGIPLLLGGPYFAAPQVREAWMDIPGLVALAAGEVEHRLPEVLALLRAKQDVSHIPGLFTRKAGVHCGSQATPLIDLDQLPFPDYRDFPWSKYPNRIVPMITGRGCGWGACLFCSDVTSTAGRTFRSHSVEYVARQIEHHAIQHDARLFVFTDLKLNSNPQMWRGVIDCMQQRAPGAKWICALHIGRNDSFLDEATLRAAKLAGCSRITTGLESGSQRMLDLMAKGATLEKTSEFLHASLAAGLSVRTTMIVGYPGETADDVAASAQFVRKHTTCIDRIMLNRFSIMRGTRIDKQIEENPQKFPGLVDLTINNRMAGVSHRYAPAQQRAYRRAMRDLQFAVHEVNARPLKGDASHFDGVM